MIETKGAFWFWFDGPVSGEASLAKIGIEIPADYTLGHIVSGEQASAIPWGTVTIDTGTVDGSGDPVMQVLDGWFALVLMPDIDVPDGWDGRLYEWPDDVPWPVEPAGWRDQIAVCQSMAASNPASPVLGVVDDAPVLNEAQIARRAARAAANAPVIEQARVTRALRSLIDGMNAEIQDRLPAKLRQTVAAIAANVTLRAQTVTDRAAQAAIAADDTKTRAERQAARDERDRLIAEIERIDAELVSDRAWRDGYAVLIAAQRAARDASAAELVNERAELDARRVTRAAAIVAINGG